MKLLAYPQSLTISVMALVKKYRYFLIFIVPVLTYIILSIYLKKLQQKQQSLDHSSHKQFQYSPTLSKRNEIIGDRKGSQAVIEDVVKQVMVDEKHREFRKENYDVVGENVLESSEKFIEPDIKNEEVLERNQLELESVNFNEVKEEHIFDKRFIEKPIAGQELKQEPQKKRKVKSHQRENSPFSIIREPDVRWCQKLRARILILVFSRPEHIYERQIIRKTWLKDLPREMYVIFVVGKSEFGKDTLESEEEFQDILQGDFKDHKRSETTKFMMTLFWFSQLQNACKVPKLVLKTVDNIYINVVAFHEWLRAKFTATKNVYLGRVVKKDQPNRDSANPRYVPKIAFHLYMFPDYLNGPQYLFSSDVVQRMSYVLKLVFPIAVEDAYIGLLCDRLQIKPIQDENFHLLMKTANVCINAKLLFIFCKSAKEMNTLHRQIISSKKSNECQLPRSKKHLGL